MNRGGRPLGSGNRLTTKMREALMRVYERLGGDDGFAAWAGAHPTEFYKLIIKAVPKESELANRASGITVNVLGVRALREERRMKAITVQAVDVTPEQPK